MTDIHSTTPSTGPRPLPRIGVRELGGHLRGWRDEGEPGPAYLALARRLRTLVLEGRVPVHTVLPSERALAEALDTSRTTTTAAYRVLRESGFASGRHGAGTWTTLPGSLHQEPWPVLHGGHAHGDVPDLTTASFEAPPGLHPAYQAALDDLPRYLPGHGYLTAGLPELRARVAQRYADRGLPTRPEQVLVTTGATQGIQVVFESLLRRGDRVLMEHPTWPMAAQSARRIGARPVVLPMEDGWDPQRLRALLAETRPALAYLIPDFHNPTGQLLDGSTRREVARALSGAGTTVVIDETTAELDLRARLGRPAGQLPPPLATLLRSGAGVSVGSASKIFWGGLRIGWVRAEEGLIHRLTQLRAGHDLAGPVVEQLATAHLLDGIAEWLPLRREHAAARCRALHDELAHRLPEWAVPLPDGGLSLWARLPAARSSTLAAAARSRGLQITSGPRFSVDGGFETRLRLPFTAQETELRRAVEVLARAWADRGEVEEVEPALVV